MYSDTQAVETHIAIGGSDEMNKENTNELMAKIYAEMQNGFKRIDERLSLVEGEIQGVKGDFQGFKSDMQGVKGDVQGLKDGMQSVKDDVQSLKDDMQSVKGDTHNLNDDMQGVKGHIQGLNSDVHRIKSNFQNDMQDVKNELTILKNILIKIEVEHGQKLSALFDGYNLYSQRLDRIEAKVTQHDEFILKRIK